MSGSTDDHARYLAHELTHRSSSDAVEKLATAPSDARVDLVSIPVPDANLRGHDLHVRNAERVQKNGKPSSKANNVNVEIVLADDFDRDRQPQRSPGPIGGEHRKAPQAPERQRRAVGERQAEALGLDP